jgi:hypothetical protein
MSLGEVVSRWSRNTANATNDANADHAAVIGM